MTQQIQFSSPQHDLPHSWVGTEWMVDALGCDENLLRELALFVSLAHDVVVDLGLQVVGQPHSHSFPFPGGVTVLCMLSESHLACHTYPEHRLATFNLYCCRERNAWPWQEELVNRLGAKEVIIRQIARGQVAGSQAAGNQSAMLQPIVTADTWRGTE